MKAQTEIPTAFTQGDRVLLELSLSNYPSETWDSTLALENGTNRMVQAGTAVSGKSTTYQFDLTPEWTLDLHPGMYTGAIYVAVKAGQETAEYPAGTRYTIERFRIEVLPDPAQKAQGLDLRTFNEVVLENAYAVMRSKATKDQQNFAVNGMSLSRYSFEELQALIETYEWRVFRERDGERMRRGMRSQATINVRF